MLITGGAGFIGSNFVRHVLEHTADRVVVLDKLTYAGNLASLEAVSGDPRYHFIHGDIADATCVERIFQEHQPEMVVNFAAESHVDRSIDAPRDFIDTNICGAFELLEAGRRMMDRLDDTQKSRFRFLHVSTDEVYGSLGKDGLFTEETPYAPNSPYSASKAAADHLMRAYWHTYGMPLLVTNCSNNYGPFQFPEKLIPLMILNALDGKDLPIYGDGLNVRDWLYVDDHCSGILLTLQHGRPGECYNIGGSAEKTNIDVVDTICEILDRLQPASDNRNYGALKRFVPDRLGHDRRYAIDAGKISRELGWKPKFDFAAGMEATIQWYLSHHEWCNTVQAEGQYGRERLGLSDPDKHDAE
jgi:dTDP-glucose 4,6-dehydratase